MGSRTREIFVREFVIFADYGISKIYIYTEIGKDIEDRIFDLEELETGIHKSIEIQQIRPEVELKQEFLS